MRPVLLSSLALLFACKGNPTPVPTPVDCTIGFADRDGDGFGNPQLETTDCVEFVVDNSDDCDDGNFSVRPDADEICDGLDNDCDEFIDEEDDSLDIPLQFPDADGDAWGLNPGVVSCETLLDHADVGGDCDDGDIAVNPDALEICDTIDNDCDGLTDSDDPSLDAINSWYADTDLDGFGGATVVLACEQPVGTAPFNDDCDDSDPAVFPGAVEICDNLDQNCDGDPDAPQFSPDPCVPLEGTYLGSYVLTVDDGATVVSCAGTATLTLDRALSPPVQGSFDCTVTNPQNGWAAQQTGAITGLFREDGTLAGSVDAFEGVPYDWTGTLLGDDLTGTASGQFVSGGAWDLEVTWDLVYDEFATP